MLRKENRIDISTNLMVCQNGDFMESLRHNLSMYIDTPEVTIKNLSEESGIPFSTLNTLLYGSSNDVKLSTVISLARALGISIDELVGSDTMEPKMRESVRIVRGLPEQSIYLIRYFIRHQQKIYKSLDKSKKYISVLKPQIVNGVIATTNAVDPMEIKNVPEDIRTRVYLGLKIPCDFYMPYYLPDEIVLLAADRLALDGERCVITENGAIHIATKKKVFENGIMHWKYSPLMTDSTYIPDDMIVDKIGYVIGFLKPDGSWGVR